MKKIANLFGAVLLGLSGSCLASGYYPDVLVNAGTQGVGLEVIQPITPNLFTISAQGNYFKYDHYFDANDGNYNGHLRLGTAGLLFNYHPFYGSFHLTAGGYYNDNKITADVNPDASGANAIADGNADVKYKKFAPYGGLGWDWGSFVVVSLDMGVMFEGKPTVEFANGCTTSCASQQEDIQSKFNDYTQYYPVIRVGVGF